MYTTVCVARAVGEGFKLQFFFGKNAIEAMRSALMARSATFESDLLVGSDLRSEESASSFEWFAARLSASMGYEERWVSARNAKEAVDILLLAQPSMSIH